MKAGVERELLRQHPTGEGSEEDGLSFPPTAPERPLHLLLVSCPTH